jgi:hypothetical protein
MRLEDLHPADKGQRTHQSRLDDFLNPTEPTPPEVLTVEITTIDADVKGEARELEYQVYREQAVAEVKVIARRTGNPVPDWDIAYQ